MLIQIAPEALFRAANLLALAGWLLLAVAIVLRAPALRDLVAGRLVPVALSLLYVGIVAAHWWSAEGGFGSLAEVARLFRSDWMLLAGWVHYLAFDLFVGAWVAGDAAARGASRWLLLPVLPVVFLFGPAGFLFWIGLRAAFVRAPGGAHVRAG